MTTPSSLATSVQQYQKAYDKAIELFNIFEDADAPELLRMQMALENEIESLLHVSGLAWGDCGNLGRHLTFLQRYLKNNEKENCAQDVKDIVFFDLPTALRNLVANAADDKHFDQRLKDGVTPLMNGGHYDSAIRKAFVVLTDRLRRAFGVAEEIDGDDLINLVFGKGGKIPVALDDAKKQAFRNLISGFYGIYRNRFAHNDVEPNLAQTRAIIEMANTIILDIEVLANKSAENI
ncbi:MAG: TIGR02391 family protein [Pseudomonadota bacterium]